MSEPWFDEEEEERASAFWAAVIPLLMGLASLGFVWLLLWAFGVGRGR